MPSPCLSVLHISRPSLSSSDPLFVCLSLAPSKRIYFQGRGSEDIQGQLIKKNDQYSLGSVDPVQQTNVKLESP